jgi:hypothetical protein
MKWLRSFWQYIRKHRVAAIITALVLVMGLIFAGYWLDWTGFNGYNQVTTAHTIRGPSAGTVVRTEVYQPGKSLWDWLQLLGVLAIPVAVGFGTVWFTHTQQQRDQLLADQRATSEREAAEKRAQTERDAAEKRAEAEREAAEKRAQTEREIALDSQREAALQAYINKMSELLIQQELCRSNPDAEARIVARVLTLTVLPRLDGERKARVLQLLYESKLIGKDNKIVDLSGADFTGAYLIGTNLHEAFLGGAILDEADLGGANLTGADLHEANLTGADLTGADLRGAYLCGAGLIGAHLNGTYLNEANLRGAYLTGADLTGAYLLEANLRFAKVTDEQLAKAESLEGATMPDGKKHD